MAELHYFTGTMGSGKSTLALQTNHNHAARGRVGRIFTTRDRAGKATVSSRLGLEHAALEVDDAFDFWSYVVHSLTHGARIDYLVCDEAQFYTPSHVEQLARIVDELQIDVFAFGILTDFRSHLFPGSARLVELADRMNVLQVEALCWCGKRATHNARTENGEMVTEGEVIVVGNTDGGSDPGTLETGSEPGSETGPEAGEASSTRVDNGMTRPDRPVIGYEVLCRQHHRRKLTAARAKAVSMVSDPLPFA